MSNQKYVMVPVEPTAEMVDRGAKEVDWYSHNARDCYAAMLAAAPQSPAVQGEPVSLRQRLFNGWAGCSNHGCVVVDPKPGMMGTNGICQCVVNASRSQLYMLQSRIQSLMAAPQPAAQNPAPDVAGLVEALEECAASLAWNCFGECRAIHAGPIMPAAQALETAREALATHQKRESR